MSGENPKARGAIDRMVKQLTENGVSHSYAQKKAREAAIRYDRKKKNTK